MLLGHVDFIEKLLNYSPQEGRTTMQEGRASMPEGGQPSFA